MTGFYTHSIRLRENQLQGWRVALVEQRIDFMEEGSLIIDFVPIFGSKGSSLTQRVTHCEFDSLTRTQLRYCIGTRTTSPPLAGQVLVVDVVAGVNRCARAANVKRRRPPHSPMFLFLLYFRFFFLFFFFFSFFLFRIFSYDDRGCREGI